MIDCYSLSLSLPLALCIYSVLVSITFDLTRGFTSFACKNLCIIFLYLYMYASVYGYGCVRVCECVNVSVCVLAKTGLNIFMTVDKYAPNMDCEHNESKIGDNECELKSTHTHNV